MNFAIAWFVGSLKSFICQGVLKTIVWSWYRCRTLSLFLNHWMLICEFCISYINSCITLPDSIYFFSFFKLWKLYLLSEIIAWKIDPEEVVKVPQFLHNCMPGVCLIVFLKWILKVDFSQPFPFLICCSSSWYSGQISHAFCQ